MGGSEEIVEMDYASDQVTESIIRCIIKVHQSLGPGFLESIYRNALLFELRRSGLKASDEKTFKIRYEGHLVGEHRLDLLVENAVVVELKTVEKLAGEHYAQLRSYLRATGLKTGLLVNFAKLKAEYRRVELGR